MYIGFHYNIILAFNNDFYYMLRISCTFTLSAYVHILVYTVLIN